MPVISARFPGVRRAVPCPKMTSLNQPGHVVSSSPFSGPKVKICVVLGRCSGTVPKMTEKMNWWVIAPPMEVCCCFFHPLAAGVASPWSGAASCAAPGAPRTSGSLRVLVTRRLWCCCSVPLLSFAAWNWGIFIISFFTPFFCYKRDNVQACELLLFFCHFFLFSNLVMVTSRFILAPLIWVRFFLCAVYWIPVISPHWTIKIFYQISKMLSGKN